MADEQPTTAPEVTNETKADAPATSTDAPQESTPVTTEDAAPDAATPDAAAAGEQATTEATGPDGETAAAQATSSDGAVVATPASAKGKRKSGAGVPEHKSKKLNKKKSMVNLITEAKPGDYFFAKFKGYAPWPAIICDESMLPETLLATRPVSTENSQGELRADYQEGGKNAKDRTYPIMFLETNEFAWIVNTALTPLNPGDTALDAVKHKMSNALKAAYGLAEDRHDIDYYKGILRDHQEQEKARQEEIAKKEAEKLEANAKKDERAKKAAADSKDKKEPKARRKSSAKSKDVVSDEDEMDVDEKETTTPKASKKRKNPPESDGEEKPKKTPKSVKLTAKDTPSGAKGESAAKKRAKKVVTKPAEEKEEEKEVLTDEQKLERREKAVLYVRHRMQKGFLARDQAPKEEEMDAMAEFFDQLESFTDLEPQVIRNTKINKVLKGIVKLASIPKEEEYNFKKRSNDLLAQWNNSLDQSKGDTPTTTAAPAEAPADGEAKTNGDSAEKKEEETKEPIELAERSKEAKDEATDVAMTDAANDDKAAEKTEEVAEPEKAEA